jgi:hypothetical protein
MFAAAGLNMEKMVAREVRKPAQSVMRIPLTIISESQSDRMKPF